MYDHKVHIGVALTKSSSVLPLPSLQWVSISDALARFATKEMTLPPPQFTMTAFLNLFPSLPCLHAFAQHSFLSSPPQRMLPVRVFADKKIVVGHLCSLPHHLWHTHTSTCRSSLDCSLLCCQYTKSVELQMPMPPIWKRKDQENDQF